VDDGEYGSSMWIWMLRLVTPQNFWFWVVHRKHKLK
jgi:hypothetical protein